MDQRSGGNDRKRLAHEYWTKAIDSIVAAVKMTEETKAAYRAYIKQQRKEIVT